MNLLDKIKMKKFEHNDGTGSSSHDNHHHEHKDSCCDHCHEHHHDHGDSCCGHNHGHTHSHGHSCGCCEDEPEIDLRKTIAGVAVFIVAFITFHIPGLFKSVNEETLDTI